MQLNWDSLPIDRRIISVIHDNLKFQQMTPVQSATVPIFLSNKDVSVEAVTGSGKTLAFLIPLLQYAVSQNDKKVVDHAEGHDDDGEENKHQKVFAVIVSPTRELASQTHAVLRNFVHDPCLRKEVNSILFVGGCAVSEDESRFNRFGGNIVVSTPGRLVDLLTKSRQIQSSIRRHMHYLVLDEADQLLELGFERQISVILSQVPKQRRTGLFSATQTQHVEQLLRAGLRDPVRIEIKQKVRAKSVKVKGKSDMTGTRMTETDPCLHVPQDLHNFHLILPSFSDKLVLLIRLIRLIRSARQPQKIIVFFASCAQVDYFHLLISNFITHISSEHSEDQSNVTHEFDLFALHRKQNKKRKSIFKRFTSCSSAVLLCTDIMARGIDVQNVQWVIHFDLPNSLQAYVHRSGRSGHKFGEEGNSLLLVLEHELSFVSLCHQKKIETKPLQVQELMTMMASDDPGPAIPIQAPDLINWIKDEARRDVNFYEQGIQAFVSFIRTYSTKCVLSQSVFPALDVIDVVHGYGLLKVPVMPEYRKRFKEYQQAFLPSMKPQDSQILNKYRDILFANKKQSDSLAHQIKHEARADLKRKRQKTRNKINSSRLKGKQKKALIDEIEMKELADDARIVKKFKKGQIDEKKFDDHFGL